MKVVCLAMVFAFVLTGVTAPGQSALPPSLPPVPAASARDIPALNWSKRSDWLDVRTDVQPAAKGDGIADDTAALQAALDLMQSGSIVFLPAGTYRITRTLILQNTVQKGSEKRLIGAALIGCGRETTIAWDGATGPEEAMLWVKSGMCHTGRYIGIAWDGKGRAGIGIDHRSDGFETEILHQHEAFRNFTGAGIRIGKGKLQSAEMLFENCLFEGCGEGISYTEFNDYDNTVDGCEFRNCGVGVRDLHGNSYIRNCHFEGSTDCDLKIHSEHGSSIRRCTSVGSRLFLNFTAYVAPLTIEQCHVARWQNPDGPIQFGGNIAPVILFDTTFSSPPNANPLLPVPGHLVLSGNQVKGGGELLRGKADAVVQVPSGKVTVAEIPAEHSFLKDTVAVPGRVFDAKRDFGAIGNGTADDTAAIQKTIDAARQFGNDAIAYLPKGDYAIGRTLSLTGTYYRFGGCGSRSSLKWKGEDQGVMLQVQDPDHVILERLGFAGGKAAVDILQTSSGKPSFMTYDGLTVYGMYQKDTSVRGFWLRGLGAESTVLIREINGNLRFTDSARARILVNTSYNGKVIVEGKDRQRDGILGFLSRFSGEKPWTLYVKDNQSLVMSDYYVEGAEQFAIFEGSEDDPPGRVVIQGAKLHCAGHPLSHTPVAINNYGGLIMLGHQQFNGDPKPSLISCTGKRACDVLLLGAEWYGTTPAVKKDAAASATRVWAVGCEVKSWNKETDKPVSLKFEETFDAWQAATLEKATAGLDELRRLGQLDLELNHPFTVTAQLPQTTK